MHGIPRVVSFGQFALAQDATIIANGIEIYYRVAPVRLCDRFVPRRLGSATTKRSGDSNEI
jgi:hypothetical protein